ncbi:MAG: cation-translocating P-type ATPase [Eubacteriales bacterium]|nr:cation-translocating P-type ATPase [Eubacteriales bacterium]MDD4421840.1 cation-translocating P-type ATPase [Eubacteriales bacterium]
MMYYLQDKNQVLSGIKTTEKGLSQAEAEARLLQNGANKLTEPPKVSMLKRFLLQLADPMIIVLLSAALVSGITSAYANESFADVFIILFVVILNSVLGVFQENKAEKAIDALREMTKATSRVLRDGEVKIVKSEELVVGDVILLEAGDSVPADSRLLEVASMKTEEAALTGESLPITKTAEKLNASEDGITLGDRKNMVYMGSSVVYGRGVAVVTETGMNTEMGKIAQALNEAKDEKTPLQQKLAQLSKILTVLVLGICLFIFVFGVIKAGSLNTDVLLNSFMVAVSLAVAAIPEGLSAVVTIVLSIGVSKMAKQNAVIRKLTAVETLGCTQIICSDKTGTLTQNKMTVVEVSTDDRELLAASMALCSDAVIDKNGIVTGEPTEAALVNFAYKNSLNKNDLQNQFPRVGEAPFDSMRKMMSTVHRNNAGFIQYTKGAPDELLKACTHVLKGGKVTELTMSIQQEILDKNKEMADRALRVLAAAYREYDIQPDSFEAADLEQKLIFIGLSGMIDPIRPEVKDAVARCRTAGIRPIMITGDHIDTAVAIGTELEIITDGSMAITGSQLDKISDEELNTVIEKYSVYARVQPEHKVRIVNAWRSKGFITAMTGDGVNDAPSIKSADIGIGMGITGTDVTKNVAEMILGDDNFATIVSAVNEGRRIYDNVKKSIQFLLSSNLSEVISVFTATVLGFTILKPVHILWINLITDSIPALALGMEKAEPDLMSRPPRKKNEGIFSSGTGVDTIYQGVMVAVLTLLAYLIGHRIESGLWEFVNSDDGITMAFLTMSMAEIFHSFNLRSQRGSIFSLKSHNKYLYGGMLASIILTAIVIYVSFFRDVFEFTHISFMEYAISLGLAVSVIPIVELVKLIQRKKV